MSFSEVFIVSAKRTPIGVLLGQFAGIAAPMLGATALKSAIDAAGVSAQDIDEVIMGCVLTAGLGQAPARQAAMAAGIPFDTGATTVNKVCGSGMKAIMLGNDVIKAGSASIVAAGGMESMSNTPHMAYVRGGVRLGDACLEDHLLRDGINNADGRSLGIFSEDCAARYRFTREQLDAAATESVLRALRAQKDGAFDAEIVPLLLKNDALISTDEGPLRADISRITSLPPAFKPDGVLTPATASGFCDGAAALLLASAEAVDRHRLKPLARIVAHATHSQEPEWFTTAPVGAIRKVLERSGWSVADVDLFEINEALAVVPLAAIHDLGLDPAKVNVNGGACALGHPIGASGARIVATLVHALKASGVKRGIASLCIGGGEGVALAIELL